jgi:hypothetical protein
LSFKRREMNPGPQGASRMLRTPGMPAASEAKWSCVLSFFMGRIFSAEGLAGNSFPCAP